MKKNLIWKIGRYFVLVVRSSCTGRTYRRRKSCRLKLNNISILMHKGIMVKYIYLPVLTWTNDLFVSVGPTVLHFLRVEQKDVVCVENVGNEVALWMYAKCCRSLLNYLPFLIYTVAKIWASFPNKRITSSLFMLNASFSIDVKMIPNCWMISLCRSGNWV